jgi:four helix bundle protein
MRQGRLTDEFRERTKRFAADVIRLYTSLPKGLEETQVCSSQLLRAGTSVAAQARQASRAQSESEFITKLGSALQHTDETQLWLELLREECDADPDLIEPLQQESTELIAIMSTILRKMNQNAAEK